MKWLAVFMSPFVGSVLLIFALYLAADKNNSEDFLLGFFFITSGSILIQILVIEPIIFIFKLQFQLTLKVYYWFAVSVCFGVTFIIFCANQTFEREVLLFLYIYSMGNVLTYNELYFKQLEK